MRCCTNKNIDVSEGENKPKHTHTNTQTNTHTHTFTYRNLNRRAGRNESEAVLVLAGQIAHGGQLAVALTEQRRWEETRGAEVQASREKTAFVDLSDTLGSRGRHIAHAVGQESTCASTKAFGFGLQREIAQAGELWLPHGHLVVFTLGRDETVLAWCHTPCVRENGAC